MSRFLIAAFLISFAPAFAHVRAQDRADEKMCAAALLPDNIRSPVARILELHGPDLYERVEVKERRLSAVVDRKYQAVVSTEHRLPQGLGGYSARIVGVRTRSAPAGWKAGAPKKSRIELETAADKALKFVIGVYGDRRAHWPPEFLEKLRAKAWEYLDRSTYIFLELPNGTPDRPMYGSIRLIAEKDGRVPMEDYLGIEVDTGANLKVEPGNLAVDKDLNKEVWPEVLLQLLSKAAREIEPGRSNHYITYADSYSRALYAHLGFTPMDMSRVKIKPGTRVENGKIFADGIWWTPMEATQETLNKILPRFLERTTDTNVTLGVNLRQAELQAANLVRQDHTFVAAKARLNGEPVDVNMMVHYETPDSVALRAMVNPPNPNILIAHIPRRDLPLKDGYKRFDVLGDVHYSGGILRVTNRQNANVIEVQVTPDLSLITNLRMRQNFAEGPPRNLDASF